MQRGQLFCRCWEHRCNCSFGIACRTVLQRQGRAENDKLVVSVSLSEIRSRVGPNQSLKKSRGDGVGDHIRDFSGQKLLQYAPAHCLGESTSPGSAVFPDVVGGLVSQMRSELLWDLTQRRMVVFDRL